MEVVVSSLEEAQEEVQMVVLEPVESSFQGALLGLELQEQILSAYLVEVGVGDNMKFLGVIRLTVYL